MHVGCNYFSTAVLMMTFYSQLIPLGNCEGSQGLAHPQMTDMRCDPNGGVVYGV